MFDIKSGDKFTPLRDETLVDVVGRPEVAILRRHDKLVINLREVPIRYICYFYIGMMPPLSPSKASHALMHYFRTAMEQYKTYIENADTFVIAAGDDWKSIPTPQFENMFHAMAQVYGVEPGAMSQAWPEIDAVVKQFQLPEVPEIVRVHASLAIH